MSWEDVLKMPPIKNPKADNVPKNDNLSMKEYEELFEEIADPIIERIGKAKGRTVAFVSLDDLDMSPEKAEKVANKLYADMGYVYIEADNRELKFKMR